MRGKHAVEIYYDGECPFCSRYVRLIRLRSSFDICFVDAREMPREARQDKFDGLDIDRGMIVIIDGATRLHGDKAMTFLANCSTRSGVFNRVNFLIFSRPRLAAALYPSMVAARIWRWSSSVAATSCIRTGEAAHALEISGAS